MADRNRRMVLAERPTGMVDEQTVRLEEADVPEPGPGEALARVRYLSIDPTIRTWMDDAPGYLPPIAIDEVVRSGGIVEVLQSNSEQYKPGDLLFGFTGWQDYVLASEAGGYQSLPDGVSPTIALSLFGITGMTAYFGLIDVGKVKEGDVVVVSGAAGATGSTVGQIAKIKGAAKVIGIAGGPQKCSWIAEELGFDETIDYKSDDVAADVSITKTASPEPGERRRHVDLHAHDLERGPAVGLERDRDRCPAGRSHVRLRATPATCTNTKPAPSHACWVFRSPRALRQR